MEPNKVNVSYQEFHDLALELAGKVIQSGVKYDYIVAPSRGGLLPAVILSHKLNLPVYPLRFSTRDHALQVEYCDIQEDLKDGKQILFVDDINDSGHTLYLFKEQMSKYHNDNENNITSCAVYQRSTTYEPSDYCSVIIEDETWINFPFENV